jgi:hypothetical protein
MLAGIVMVITAVAHPLVAQDTTRQDSVPPVPAPVTPQNQPVPAPASVTVSPAPPTPTIEQVRYMEGLKTVTRGVAQIRDGVSRVTRAQQADSVTRRNAARRLGGLCGTARSFISSGRPKMQATAYADSMRLLAKQLTTRLDSLTTALPTCEKTAGRDPAVVSTNLTTRLKNYDDALLAFRTAQAVLYKPDSTKTVSQQ